jgi:predicted GH43/DUF377 family glycosyl hydrolase
VTAPYNPSIVESASGYDLFFRYDVIKSTPGICPYSSRIGVVGLNKLFEQEDKEYKRIDLKSDYVEDPRALFVGNQLFLLFNWSRDTASSPRYMCVANLDQNSHEVNYSTVLNLNLRWIEKNWSPFEYTDENNKEKLFLEYQLSPHKLLELPNPQNNDLKDVGSFAESAFQTIPWSGNWGELRGGTPAKKIGNEYLAFFHSSFVDETNLRWFVMGAYTFSSTSPFNVTGVSKYPILFKDIYETPFINTSDITKRVIYPSGFVMEKKDGCDLIHLSCGENDCSVKVVTINKDKLLENMIRIEIKK